MLQKGHQTQANGSAPSNDQVPTQCEQSHEIDSSPAAHPVAWTVFCGSLDLTVRYRKPEASSPSHGETHHGSTRFDRIARAFEHSQLSRRSAISGASLGVAGALAGSVISRAQGTPTATDSLAADNSILFVQTAAGGTFLPTTEASSEAGDRGSHVLTLSGHPGQTIIFSDRLQRTSGQAPT